MEAGEAVLAIVTAHNICSKGVVFSPIREGITNQEMEKLN